MSWLCAAAPEVVHRARCASRHPAWRWGGWATHLLLAALLPAERDFDQGAPGGQGGQQSPAVGSRLRVAHNTGEVGVRRHVQREGRQSTVGWVWAHAWEGLAGGGRRGGQPCVVPTTSGSHQALARRLKRGGGSRKSRRRRGGRRRARGHAGTRRRRAGEVTAPWVDCPARRDDGTLPVGRRACWSVCSRWRPGAPGWAPSVPQAGPAKQSKTQARSSGPLPRGLALFHLSTMVAPACASGATGSVSEAAAAGGQRLPVPRSTTVRQAPRPPSHPAHAPVTGAR